jgi:hypothetical protein
MELVLNLAWLAIAFAALCKCARLARPERKQFLIAMGALGCALLLLFPAVSISDDLHFQALAVEDSTLNKRVASVGSHANPVSPPLWFPCSLLAALFAGLCQRKWFNHQRPGLSYVAPLLQYFRLGRAPPVLVLL